MTRHEAQRKAAELNGATIYGDDRYYTVDQSPVTGAFRVIEHREGYFRKVAAS